MRCRPQLNQPVHVAPRLVVSLTCPVAQRWAVYQACSLLRKYKAEYEALQAAMASGVSVPDCVAAIEKC